jgi:hypothetical protein
MEHYVDAINKGIVPDIRGTWENVAAVENTKALELVQQVGLLFSFPFFFFFSCLSFFLFACVNFGYFNDSSIFEF